ncbi:MAG: hypothetical protein ACKPBU_09855, partial [Alphaproteobacteria bacterium]
MSLQSRTPSRPLVRTLLLASLLAGCGDTSSLPPEARLSTALSPTRSAAYYVEQANVYFDGLDLRADPAIVP